MIEDRGLNEAMGRKRTGRQVVSIATVAVLLLLLLILLPQTLLTIFAGLLFSVLIRTCGVWFGEKLAIGPRWGLALFLMIAISVVVSVAIAVAPIVSEQLGALKQELPRAYDSLKIWLEGTVWGDRFLEHFDESDLWSFFSGRFATRAVGSVFEYVGNAILLLFIALYVAFDPKTYKGGLLRLLAPSVRADAQLEIARCLATLRSWLSAQLISMTVVGVLTGIGLWLTGIPLAMLLGLLAGVLAFIPNIGPVLAATPGLLLAVPDGPNSVLMVLGVYLAVQIFESYVVTPLVQRQKVSLPPVLVIASQLALGTLFGIIGLALATPLTAVAMQLVKDLYVRRYLEERAVTQQTSL